MSVRYIFSAQVLSVYQEKIQVSVATKRVDESGKRVFEREVVNTGRWFVRISESSAICVGGEKPDLQPGDTVELTMMKKE